MKIRTLLAASSALALISASPVLAQGVDPVARGLGAAAISAANPAATLTAAYGKQQALPGFVNWGPQSANSIIRDIANVTGPIKTAARWAIIGDSTDQGHCSVAASPCTDNRLYAWPVRLGALMNAAGIPTDTDSWFGCDNQVSIAACTAFDSRLSFGTGYVLLSQIAVGGFAPNFPANTTPAPLTFTTGDAFNQADVYLINGTAASSLVIDRAGTAPSSSSVGGTTGAPCSVSGGVITTTAGVTGVCKVAFTWASTAAGALNINASSNATGKFYILGEAERDTNNPKIEIYNMAIGGTSSVAWAQPAIATYGPGAALTSTFANPTTTFNGLAVNDWNTTGETLATYQSNMTILQTQANATGGNVFIMGMQSNPAAGFASVALQQQFGAVTEALSISANQPWINFQYRWTNWANGAALGFYGANSGSPDGRHGSAAGYQDQANMIMGAIRHLVGP